MTEKKVVRRSNTTVQKELLAYKELYQDSTPVDKRKAEYKTIVTSYYSLTTDAYEYALGKSIHCANRFRGETFAESIQRHESYLALRMQPKPGDKVLDIGCGVGGPLRRIARLTGAHVTGITISPYQVQRAIAIGVPDNCQFIEGDFMELPFENNSFDHVYAIESICHAPEKSKCFAEVFRVLKPGGSFVGYDVCLTGKYDDQNREHVEAMRTMEANFGLPELKSTHEFVSDLQSVGFTIEENRIILEGDFSCYQCYQRLDGGDSFFSLINFRTSPLGRWLGRNTIWLLEKARIFSKGSTAICDMFQRGAKYGLRAANLDIVTSMFFFLARKP
ncbi:unnamed protein product [Rotaria sordida]|uniref:Methyltransferase n=1 Tax=Rotaria sordida TaxID=392033 RepID=A0A819CJA3_9BILA|nr:unnamed protein product [Rotaria sordida]CAF1022631.1 unnamed protein product [Rotaria sordida]CAF3819051.1 unnamed protein product [Rotaria sordida]